MHYDWLASVISIQTSCFLTTSLHSRQMQSLALTAFFILVYNQQQETA